MSRLHSLLKRQLRRFALEGIPLPEEPLGFLRAINDAYRQFDADRRMLEQSLELTSQECSSGMPSWAASIPRWRRA